MSSDDIDSQIQQFEQMYEQKLGNDAKQVQPKKLSQDIKSDSAGDNLQAISTSIMRERKPSGDKSRTTAMRRPKWDNEATKIFFKLHSYFSGDLDMINHFFNKHTTFVFTKSQIKKKYNTELKKNPDKFLRQKITKLHPKMMIKLDKLANSLLNPLSLDKQQQSMMSKIESPKRSDSKDSADLQILNAFKSDINQQIHHYNRR